QFIHAPMLPWVSDNAAALAKIRGLMETGKGKYYVHCGLGRDRTNVVRRLVEAGGMQVATSGDLQHASTFADRMREPVAEKRDMQRGALRELEPGVWLIPHPNQSELSGYMLAGQVRTVVLLLDPSDPEQRAWRDEEERAFRTSSVQFVERPVVRGETDRLAAIAAEVRALPHPVAVVAPRTPYSNGVAYQGTEAAVGFMQAYKRLSRSAAAGAAR
ncbi:MAG TPA: hypothetical protein VF665_20975, partial [Longimicrobium sp.]